MFLRYKRNTKDRMYRMKVRVKLDTILSNDPTIEEINEEKTGLSSAFTKMERQLRYSGNTRMALQSVEKEPVKLICPDGLIKASKNKMKCGK